MWMEWTAGAARGHCGCPGAAAGASSREQNPRPTPENPLRALGLRPDLISLTDVTLFCLTSSFGAVTSCRLKVVFPPRTEMVGGDELKLKGQ